MFYCCRHIVFTCNYVKATETYCDYTKLVQYLDRVLAVGNLNEGAMFKMYNGELLIFFVVVQ